MEKVILVKYGELTTKKDNRNFFINALKKNIELKLKDIKYEVKSDYYRMFIYVLEEDINKTLDILSNVFGIHGISVAYLLKDKSIENLYYSIEEYVKTIEFSTFKIVTKRSDKSFLIKSMDLSSSLGGVVLKYKKNVSVDVHNPNIIIYVEIRQEGIYIYSDNIKGKGGYPVGVQGKALLMLSGGIDSPVAAYLSIKRGIKLDYIYFESIPHTSLEARNKIINLANIIDKYGNGSNIYIINFTKIQEYIYNNFDKNYMITIMRREMYRIAEIIAKKHKCNAIINGESIGQVASQTLTSIRAVNEVTSFPVIRPLATYDKEEIIKISKEIGTYETSILPFLDCCTVFVPTHPIINPDISYINKMEENNNMDILRNEVQRDIIKISIPINKELNEYL
ncbi:MAG: tRNA uracil 4-sulfurtransferase ThiI [Bacilli bacterium]